MSRILVLLLACLATTAQVAPVQRSHIEANVPDANAFGTLLKRDLKDYFAASNPSVVISRVDYELLREAATQSGVAFPKFYMWVKVYAGRMKVAEGAVRAAAIERKRFEITHFIARGRIRGEPDLIQKIFPPPLHEPIHRLAEGR